MKIGIISDLHSDLYKEKGIDLLNELNNYFIQNKDIEVLLIAGDITEDINETIKFIENLKKKIEIKIYYVPGNHDIWQKQKIEIPTEDIVQKYAADKNCITGKVIQLRDDLVVIGDTGWYDYSFGYN
ncbi:MAG: metallophosphoesterase [Cetobacterium sp.]